MLQKIWKVHVYSTIYLIRVVCTALSLQGIARAEGRSDVFQITALDCILSHLCMKSFSTKGSKNIGRKRNYPQEKAPSLFWTAPRCNETTSCNHAVCLSRNQVPCFVFAHQTVQLWERKRKLYNELWIQALRFHLKVGIWSITASIFVSSNHIQ